MRHRHLDTPTGHWSIATIDSVLERGGASEILELLRELRRDPWGAAATAALAAAEHSQVYGYPELIRACLERWRYEAKGDRLGSGAEGSR
jgi:hypothetical protein